jgi:hypothetical protein
MELKLTLMDKMRVLVYAQLNATMTRSLKQERKRNDTVAHQESGHVEDDPGS